MRSAISAAVKLLAIAVVSGASQAAAQSPEPTLQWEYRVLSKAQILNLGKQDLAAGLNKLGDEGWELAAFDAAYIFKRPKVQREQVDVIKLRLKIAEADVEQQRERVQWSQRMVKRGFLPANQLKEEERLLKELEIALIQAQADAKSLPAEPIKAPRSERKPDK
jgi:hypothetical protein